MNTENETIEHFLCHDPRDHVRQISQYFMKIVLRIDCWLINRKSSVRVPGQTSKLNTERISSAVSSQQISGKISESK